MTNNLMEKVLKTIRNYGLFLPGDSVLVACSGGPDSVFLLHALIRLRGKLGLGKITVCNIDHGLRGKESRDDSLFVKTLSKKLGLRCLYKKVDVFSAKSGGLSTEEAARKARYAFFRSAARRARARVIATGHTLDDQAETVLMRFIKGASLKGIVGIAPSRMEGAYRIVRPLIGIEKREIVRYLEEGGIKYRVDHTNEEPVYFRNIVRNEIVPFLEKYNPGLKRALFNLSEHLREDFEFIDNAVAGARGMVSAKRGAGVRIALKDLVILPRAIQKEILRDCLRKAGGDVKKLSFGHWKEVENLVNRNGKGRAVHLPGGISASRDDRSLTFNKI